LHQTRLGIKTDHAVAARGRQVRGGVGRECAGSLPAVVEDAVAINVLCKMFPYFITCTAEQVAYINIESLNRTYISIRVFQRPMCPIWSKNAKYELEMQFWLTKPNN
jgi:hypothetical protein